MKGQSGRRNLSQNGNSLVHHYIEIWLRGTEMGRGCLDRFDGDIDQAKDGVTELLNAGFLKMYGDGHGGIGGIDVCNPPRPPAGKVRPKGEVILS